VEGGGQIEKDLIGSGLLPEDLMTRVVSTVIGWEGEGTVALERGSQRVLAVDGKKQAAVVLRLQILNRFGTIL
jgi:hypothetical protein